MFYITPQEHESIVIVGIDPGTDSLGFSIIECHPSGEILSTNAFTFRGKKIEGYDKNLEKVHTARMARLFSHRQNLIKLFHDFKPNIVASETPYFNPRTPGAYGPLVETLWCIREALWSYKQTLSLVEVEPRVVKQAIDVKKVKGKDYMREGLTVFKDILKLSEQQISEMSEHAVDATAVAYAAYLKLRKKELE